MAQKKTVLTEYIDDLTGDVIPEDQVQVVHFGWNDVPYEIDLSKLGAAKLEKFLEPYVSAARRVHGGRGKAAKAGGSTRAPSGSGKSKEELANIREWAAKNGHEISPRGRIAAPILEAYDAAHAPANT